MPKGHFDIQVFCLFVCLFCIRWFLVVYFRYWGLNPGSYTWLVIAVSLVPLDFISSLCFFICLFLGDTQKHSLSCLCWSWTCTCNLPVCHQSAGIIGIYHHIWFVLVFYRHINTIVCLQNSLLSLSTIP
jgi:hypothetical protein